MITLILVVIVICALFAYVPLTLVFIHSREGRIFTDKYHEIKKKYWQTDYYGDSESTLSDLETDLERYHNGK